MDFDAVRNYCLSLPLVTEDMAFGDEYLLFRVGGKIFACLGLVRPDYFTLKCDPEYAIELRDRYNDIAPAWHWNKKYWNQVSMNTFLPDEFVKSLIRHSYSEVVKKLRKDFRTQNPQICEIKSETTYG